MDNLNKPLLIVLSCTRNYGWVTRAFLAGNSRWADYIVIVDQMSTDGTREICAEYGEKVVIVDDKDMTYKESTRAIIAFNKGRELASNHDHIFFALDIDEVMPANWMTTDDGKRVLNSKPGDEFSIHWANLRPDKETYYEDGCNDPWQIQYKIFHDDSKVLFQESNKQLHTPLLPYVSYDTPPIEIKDFLLLHFGNYNEKWNKFKKQFYQVLDVRQKRSRSIVKLSRFYCKIANLESKVLYVKKEWLFSDFDIFGLVEINTIPLFVGYMKEIIEKDGINEYVMLDIWSEELCKALGIDNPQHWYHKLFSFYLKQTSLLSESLPIRILDKGLSLLIR